MTRQSRPRLSVVRTEPAAPKKPEDAIALETHRLVDIELAAQTLHLSAVRLRATPRYPEIAHYRETMRERFEEAVNLMRETLGDA